MKKYRRTLATLALLMILNGCAANAQTIETEPPTMAATESAVRPPAEESGPPPTEETNPVRESVEETEEASVTEPAEPKVTEPKKPEHQPETTEPPATQPPKKDPPATDPPTTDPPATEPTITPPTSEIIRPKDVEDAIVKYLNQNRSSALTKLKGLSKVARYRSRQLSSHFSHNVAAMREALAYYQYGRYVDATQYGDPVENSYYEYDGREAIAYRGQGAQTMTADELGMQIAEQIMGSNRHWSYVGSTEYSYVGIGATKSEGVWYICVMVSRSNYG